MKLYSNIFTLKMSLTIDTFQYLIALLRCKYTVVHKSCATYFLNRSMKHWPILIIFGRWHQKNLTQMTAALAISA